MRPATTLPFVARQEELKSLEGRLKNVGMTGVTGRAQQGKTRLLEELCNRLRSSNVVGPNTAEETRPLVGFVELQSEVQDAMLRVVSDLYTNWAASAQFKDRAGVYRKRLKEYSDEGSAWGMGVLGDFISGQIDNAEGPVAGGGVARALISKAITPFQQMRSGGMQLPTLGVDRARELLSALHAITNRPAVLIFDQWDRSPDVDREFDQIKSFLDHIANWSPCHVIVSARAGTTASDLIEQIARDYARADLLKLGPILFDTPRDLRCVIDALAVECVVTSELSEQDLIDCVDGNPAVLMRWLDQGPAIDTVEQLYAEAIHAHRSRYPELEALVEKLSDDARCVVIRLINIPMADKEAWNAIRSQVFQPIDDPDAAMDELIRAGLVNITGGLPNLGHTTRIDALKTLLSEKYLNGQSAQLVTLVNSLADKVISVEKESEPFASTIASLEPTLEMCVESFPDARGAWIVSCSAATLFEEKRIRQICSQSELTTKVTGSTVTLVSMGLFNTLHAAGNAGEIDQRDALLAELRALAKQYPHEPVVTAFAKAIYAVSELSLPTGNHKFHEVLCEEALTLAIAHENDVTVAVAVALWSEALQVSPDETKIGLINSLREWIKKLPEGKLKDALIQVLEGDN